MVQSHIGLAGADPMLGLEGSPGAATMNDRGCGEMRHSSRTPRRSVVGALTAVAAGIAVATVVLPAFAGGGGGGHSGGQIPPASGRGITPTDFTMGGKTTDCSLIKSTAPYSFQIANPATQTYSTTAPNGLPVTFTLTVASDKKSFGFTSTGAAVYDISVAPTSIDEKDDDDPTGTAWYQYSKAAIGPVTYDTALHTTKSKKGVFHAVSRVTFCYASAASISGTVVNDANNNGAKNSGETGQAGWTVNLEKTGGAQPFATTQTGSGGAYTFASVPVGSAYSVCIVPPSGWKQTFPTGATSGCAAAGAPAGESNAGFALPTLVKNQKDKTVLIYTPLRMMQGR